MAEPDLFQTPDAPPQAPPPPVDAAAFRQVVETRRSVRVFDGTPIPRSVVDDCLDQALLAPNSSNLQPWEFYWVRSPEKKAALAEACMGQPAAATAAELIVCVARTATWAEHARLNVAHLEEASDPVPPSALTYYKKLVPFVYTMGPLGLMGWVRRVVFTLQGLKKPMVREPLTRADLRQWAVKTCALACENLMLAFRSHGFDTCPMEGFDAVRVHRLLKLPKDAYVVMVVAAGKRAPNGVYGPRIRFERSRFVKEV